MYFWVIQFVIRLANRVGGMTVQDLVDSAGITKYRARIIMREMVGECLIFRRGNKYYYVRENTLAFAICDAARDEKPYAFQKEQKQ